MQDINLYQLIKFFAKKWYVVLLITIIGVGAGYVYNEYVQTPLYKSSATLILVSPDGKRSGTQDVTLINNYLQLFKSRRVLEPVIKEQHIAINYDTLVKSIEATNEKGTEVIKVAISTPNAGDSKKLVEGSIDSFRNEAEALYDLDNIKVVDAASYPEQPYNVSTVYVLAASGLGGFAASLIALFIAYDYRRTHKPTPKAPKPAKQKKVAKKKDRVSIVSRIAGASRKNQVIATKAAPEKKTVKKTAKKSTKRPAKSE